MRGIVGTRAEKLDSNHHKGMAGQRRIVNREAFLVEPLQLIDEQLKIRVEVERLLGSGMNTGEDEKRLTMAQILRKVEDHAHHGGHRVGDSFEDLEAVDVQRQHNVAPVVLRAEIRRLLVATFSLNNVRPPRRALPDVLDHGPSAVADRRRLRNLRQAQQRAVAGILEKVAQTRLHAHVVKHLLKKNTPTKEKEKAR